MNFYISKHLITCEVFANKCSQMMHIFYIHFCPNLSFCPTRNSDKQIYARTTAYENCWSFSWTCFSQFAKSSWWIMFLYPLLSVLLFLPYFIVSSHLTNNTYVFESGHKLKKSPLINKAICFTLSWIKSVVHIDEIAKQLFRV